MTIGPATPEDAADIWRLAAAAGLDRNSPYAYLLLCSDFADTTLVARDGDRLFGFVAGYCPPAHDDTVFVWQIGVADAARGQGMGGRLLDALARTRPGARWLEATVTPDNEPSRQLFRSFARRRGARCEVSERFGAHLFPDDSHPREDRFRIGPLRSET